RVQPAQVANGMTAYGTAAPPRGKLSWNPQNLWHDNVPCNSLTIPGGRNTKYSVFAFGWGTRFAAMSCPSATCTREFFMTCGRAPGTVSVPVNFPCRIGNPLTPNSANWSISGLETMNLKNSLSLSAVDFWAVCQAAPRNTVNTSTAEISEPP